MIIGESRVAWAWVAREDPQENRALPLLMHATELIPGLVLFPKALRFQRKSDQAILVGHRGYCTTEQARCDSGGEVLLVSRIGARLGDDDPSSQRGSNRSAIYGCNTLTEQDVRVYWDWIRRAILKFQFSSGLAGARIGL